MFVRLFLCDRSMDETQHILAIVFEVLTTRVMGNTAPYVVSFLLRFIYGVMHILTKAAFNQGTSTYVLNFYRHAIATMFLLPIAFAIERYAKFWLLSYLVLDVI